MSTSVSTSSKHGRTTCSYYNQQRPHRALNGATPLVAFNARLKARPTGSAPETHFRVRHNKVDTAGRITLRYLHHIGLGAAFRGLPVTILVANKHIRVLHEDGSMTRELILDPSRDYQPLGTPSGRPKLGHHDVRQVATIT